METETVRGSIRHQGINHRKKNLSTTASIERHIRLDGTKDSLNPTIYLERSIKSIFVRSDFSSGKKEQNYTRLTNLPHSTSTHTTQHDLILIHPYLLQYRDKCAKVLHENIDAEDICQ